MGKVRVIVFEAFGETWASVAAFAKEHANDDRARYERIRSRIYKGLCTAEQAVELERHHGEHRRKRMAEMRSENEAKGIACKNTRKGPPKPRPFDIYEKHHDELCMRLLLREKTPYRDSTVYEITHYCCGSTILMTHAQLLRREQGGFRFCYACGRTGAGRRKATARIAALIDMPEEYRDAFLDSPDSPDSSGEEEKPVEEKFHDVCIFPASPPESVRIAQSRSDTDIWQDRMYRQWEGI